MILTIQKGVVQAVSANRHEVRGTLTTGAEFVAYYYGATPVNGDIVFVAPVADGSWLVVTGPTTAQGLFGVGGDGSLTITANTATDTGSRVTSADGTFGIPGVTPANAFTVTSASAAFTSADVGSLISGTGIAAGSMIIAVASATSVTVSQPVTSGGASVVLTITGTPGKWTKSGSVFTLTRDLYCTDLTLDPSDGVFTVNTAGYRIFCLGTLLIGAGLTVHQNGNAASGTTAGGNVTAGSIGRAVGAGAAAPAATSNRDGIAAAAVTTSIATLSSSAIQSGGYGGYTTSVISGFLGRYGGLGGTVINAITNGWPAYVPKIMTLDVLAGTTLFAGGAGGGSGGQIENAGGDMGTARAGAGGGGAGIVAIFARQLVNLGIITANGGAGSAATIGTGTDCALGGGGGGGGGAMILVYGATGSTIGQVSATGGTAGGGFAGTGGLGSALDSPVSIYGDATFTGGGGTGGTYASAGAFFTAVAGSAGQPGLIWALPL